MVDLQHSKPKVTHTTTRLPPVITDRDQLVRPVIRLASTAM